MSSFVIDNTLTLYLDVDIQARNSELALVTSIPAVWMYLELELEIPSNTKEVLGIQWMGRSLT